MTRGKPLQTGVRVRLAPGLTWEDLAALSPTQIRDQDLFPGGFLPSTEAIEEVTWAHTTPLICTVGRAAADTVVGSEGSTGAVSAPAGATLRLRLRYQHRSTRRTPTPLSKRSRRPRPPPPP